MSSRTNRKVIAQDTLEIIKRGNYTTKDGRRLNIAEDVKEAIEGSIGVEPDGFDTFFAQCQELTPVTNTRIEVFNETTFAGARALWNAGRKEVVALNFASAKNPGGGFLNGSQAQEEALARASALYPCLTKNFSIYEKNRQLTSCLYADRMVYAPGVPVFRDDNDRLIADPYKVSIITSPAVNAGALKDDERPEIAATMRRRIQKLLALALAKGHRTIILGAWGCGVFRNDPADVARYFREAITGEYANLFELVRFSVLDRPDGNAIAAFKGYYASLLA